MGAMDYYLGGAAARKKWLAAFFAGIDDAEIGEMVFRKREKRIRLKMISGAKKG
jgi:hypothetical protein